MSQNDLNALLTSSRALTSQLSRPDLPSINLSLDQIEAQSRRLISRQQGAESSKANYLLAQAHVDASTLGNSIANLNTSTIFQPLQPLSDTDVTGFINHAHEQTILSSIEEGRRDTQAEFYRVLEERVRRDWEGRKKRILDEFGVRGISSSDQPGSALQLRHSVRGLASSRSMQFTPNLQMRAKMNAYTRVVAELNSTRLAGASYPIIQALKQAAQQISERSPFIDMLNVLSYITQEPPGLQAISRAGVHMLNAPMFERKFARAYTQSGAAGVGGRQLRAQIARGAREALEQQYWDVLTQTVHSHQQQANLGGDPSSANYVRAFCTVRLYSSGKWDERLEIVNNTPLWAKLYYLIRTGKVEEALVEAEDNAAALNARERNFTTYLRAWAESEERKLPRSMRDRLLSAYNSHVLHAPTTDPFKLALYKLIGKLDPTKRTVAFVTGGIEDWMWFQLAMVDEEDGGIGLKELTDVVLGYGERYFEPPKSNLKGMWARVLLLCGAFEQAVAALNEKAEFQVEATHLAIALAYHGLLRVPERFEATDGDILLLAPASPAALNLSLLISRYIRPIMQSDPKEALEYVACVCLTCDQSDAVGKEQMELAWEHTRRIVVSLDSDAKWEMLVGGFRGDGTRISGAIESYTRLLRLQDAKAYNEQILLPAAAEAERESRVNEAIKLYNLAGAYETVVACLARFLGDTITESPTSEESLRLEATAREILRHYERTNRAAGRERGVVTKLLNAREARECKEAGRVDRALELMEMMELVPLMGDQTAIRRAGEALMHQDDAIARNLGYFLQTMMEILKQQRDSLRYSNAADPHRLAQLRKKANAIQSFAGALRGKRLSPDVYEHISRMAVDIAL
ncbi:NIC-domain-containing protein [Exidia glandulosa HHB12029]|uniref:Nuclear pore protein n=1 Tax=Exidia glandulosa HHB12029 TaxID=1314781 RepID=A0A165PM85_EXIGL|nr:NIC-domain-containing protein [Exidia glandulosa HHB12029]